MEGRLSKLRLEHLAADSIDHDVDALAVVRSPNGLARKILTRVARRLRRRPLGETAPFLGTGARATTRAPASFASCSAGSPTPPVAPVTSTALAEPDPAVSRTAFSATPAPGPSVQPCLEGYLPRQPARRHRLEPRPARHNRRGPGDVQARRLAAVAAIAAVAATRECLGADDIADLRDRTVGTALPPSPMCRDLHADNDRETHVAAIRAVPFDNILGRHAARRTSTNTSFRAPTRGRAMSSTGTRPADPAHGGRRRASAARSAGTKAGAGRHRPSARRRPTRPGRLSARRLSRGGRTRARPRSAGRTEPHKERAT